MHNTDFSIPYTNPLGFLRKVILVIEKKTSFRNKLKQANEDELVSRDPVLGSEKTITECF